MTRRVVTRCVAIAVAIALAAGPAWGHSFPQLRTVVLQVERCEVVAMIGYRPASGEASESLLARIASQPKSHRLEAAKQVMAQAALTPLSFTLDGKPLVPTSVRAKLGAEPGGTRPLVVVLVTFSLPAGGALAVTSREPRSTRISWTDRDSGRVDLTAAPGQVRWFTGVASFLLSLAPSPGDSPCVHSKPSD